METNWNFEVDKYNWNKKKKVGEFSSSFEQKESATEIWDYPVLEKWTVPETFETLWNISTYA